MNYDDRVKKVDELLTEKGFNGVVVIDNNDKIILSEGYGYANFEHSIPNTPRTPMRIASITKQFTACAVIKLFEKNLIKPDDTVNKYIPDYPNGEKITIHHLLTHTSGISNFELEYDFYYVLHSESVLNALIDLFKNKPLQFEPGSKFAYSISGFLILQYIIESVTKMSYIDYLKENIFKPLGMENTGYDYYQDIIKNRASAYYMVDGEVKNAEFVDMQIAGAGGGLYSAAEDLNVFNAALMAGRIISKDSLDMMFAHQFSITEAVHSGYGIFIQHCEYFGKVRIKRYHMGGGTGVRSVNIYFPDDGLRVTMVSNVDDKDIFNAAMKGTEEILLTE